MAEQRHDLRFGILSALIANQWRTKSSRALQPSDFFPSLRELERPRQMTAREMHEACLRLVKQFGGRVIKRQRN